MALRDIINRVIIKPIWTYGIQLWGMAKSHKDGSYAINNTSNNS